MTQFIIVLLSSKILYLMNLCSIDFELKVNDLNQVRKFGNIIHPQSEDALKVVSISTTEKILGEILGDLLEFTHGLNF